MLASLFVSESSSLYCTDGYIEINIFQQSFDIDLKCSYLQNDKDYLGYS